MKIAYLTSYVGNTFRSKYCQGKYFALSGSLKSQGIARALMAAGHEVVIYSPGITTCNCRISSFFEIESYPEGELTIRYCDILSKHMCSPVNDLRISRLLRKECGQFDVFLYYNVTLGAALSIGAFKRAIKLLEYEDNIFNKALAGDKNRFVWMKRLLYHHIINQSDGVLAVCLGLQLKSVLKYSILIPGIINDDVVKGISSRRNFLVNNKPVHIILTGGIHYSKGGDLLVKAMSYIKTPCTVTVYGNCSLDDSLKTLISSIPSRHHFCFNGYMPHEDLIKILDRDADILINTTRSMGVGAQAAGFPFKMMEYASTGRPIVSSEIGKLDEEYNRHITYYENERPEAIAEAVEEVIAHYDEKVQLALELQKVVLNEYTVQGMGKKLNVFLKGIADNES